jgi:hypothetical protein
MQVGWDIETGYLFTFDPVPSATGIRIIGKAHGSSLDVDGFIAVTDLQVFAKSAPAMAPRAAKQKKSKP